jgi:predicted lysophospholipase L1 biosynthesis ABC-type transport system permease subunit
MVFTLLLIVMSVIIMHFSIKNFIELNIQNIGLLQATGYTARSLRLACVTEQMIIGLIATCAGIGAGVLCNAPLNSLSGMLNGLSGTGDISITALVSTLVSIPLMVLAGSFIATRSYKKMSVLESLRSGITAHNFKKNHFPLETSRLPLELAIACKNNFGAMKKSIFIILIVAVLTASTCIGFALFQNWALDNKMLLKVVGVEIADIMATTPGDEDFIEDMKGDSDVQSINTKTSLKTVEVSYQDHTESLGIDVFRDVSSLRNNYLLEGHMPYNGNEIVLTCVEADNLNVTLGDIVNVKSMTDSGTIPFTVCGIDQKMNNTGKKAILSEEGAERINSEFMYETTLIYLNDPAKAKEIKKQLEKDYPDYTFALGEDIMASSIDTVTKAMEGICVIFVIATCFVVILTQLLLTRAQVIRERTDLGVSKALGYTSGELIRRTLMTNLPTIAIGIIIGIILHIAVSNQLFLVVFSFFGIRQIVFNTNAIWFVITAALIMLCAIVTAFTSGRGIAKLEPVKILKEE